MITHYLKIAIRNLAKYKVFTIINIAGLATGMAACLLILQYVSFQLSYDQFNKNAKDIYRVVNDRYQNGKLIQHGTITYSAIGKAMKDDYEEVINNVRIEPSGERILFYKEKKLPAEHVMFVDNSFFSVFTYPLLAGNTNTVLRQPYSIILGEDLARNLFDYKGNDWNQYIGTAIRLQRDSILYKIDGICANVPENSHLKFNLLISYPTLITNWKESDYDFTQSDFWHYVQLSPRADYKKLNSKLAAFSQRHFQGNKVSGSDETFYLQPLSRAHLYSDFEYEIAETGSGTVVWGLLTIALFIITIAWVNYINLSTARSVERAREVGIRKVIGGVRRQLILQFLSESLLVNVLGILLALGLVFMLQHSFNTLLQHDLSLSYLLTKGLNGYTIFIALMVIVVLGIIVSGFYPAFVLSAFQPISVLKGKLSHSKKGIAFRKLLVVAQFTITIALIIGSIVVIKQIRFMNNKPLGFNMDQVLLIKSPMLTEWDSTFIDRVNSFKEELKQLSFVSGAATSWSVPGGEVGRSFNVRRGDSANTDKYTMRQTAIDYDFLDVFGVRLLAGRNFTRSDHDPDFSKLHNTLINRSAAKLLGFSSPQDAIGKTIWTGDRKWDVIGVVEDYHQKSLRYPMEPMRFMPAFSTYSDISVKLRTRDISKNIAVIRGTFEKFFPGNLFDYSFVDDNFNKQYENDRLFAKAFSIFAALAIFVASLGLFGLAMFTTLQRTKEIGIRKVLGATVSNILLLLSRDFIKLVVVASCIAIPAAFWVMHLWLQDFTYRTSVGWWIYAVSAAGALIIAIVTISVQALQSALANPVRSLRTE